MKTKNNAEFPTANELASKPKMPEVIYVRPSGDWSRYLAYQAHVSYTRTDKVQELREALRECVKAFNACDGVYSSAYYSRLRNQALTKASNLLK